MTVSVDNSVDVSGNGTAWRLYWSSDLGDPLFRIYRNGRFVRATRETSAVFTMRGGTWDVIEIVDSDTEVPLRAAEPEATIVWEPVAEAVGYRVEEYVDGEWVERERVTEDGSSEYEITTNPLGDLQQYQFRVVPFGLDGNDGTPATITVELVRHPDPPNVAFAFDDETKKVTVTG